MRGMREPFILFKVNIVSGKAEVRAPARTNPFMYQSWYLGGDVFKSCRVKPSLLDF